MEWVEKSPEVFQPMPRPTRPAACTVVLYVGAGEWRDLKRLEMSVVKITSKTVAGESSDNLQYIYFAGLLQASKVGCGTSRS